MLSTRIEVSGLNLPKLLNALSKAGVTATNVAKLDSKRTTFCIYTKECRKTFAILKKMCYNYRIVEQNTLFSLVLSVAKRCGVLLGLAVFLLVAYFCDNFVLGLKIDGASEECAADVLTVAESSSFGFLPSVDLDGVRRSVLSLDSVADAQVSRKGNYIAISVIERDVEHSETPKLKTISSRRDATITKVVVNSGFALVKAGDRVFAGAPLISSERANADGTTSTSSYAAGIVYGEVVYRKTLYAPKEKQTTVYSRPYYETRVSLDRVSTEIADADYVIESGTFDIFLPVRITRSTVRSKSVITAATNPDVEASKELDAFETSLGFADASEKRYSVAELNDGYLIDLFVKRIEIIT